MYTLDLGRPISGLSPRDMTQFAVLGAGAVAGIFAARAGYKHAGAWGAVGGVAAAALMAYVLVPR